MVKTNLIGMKFTRWTVMSESKIRDVRGRIKWVCRCECGAESLVSGDALKSRRSKSCGCLKTEILTKHGLRHTSEYRAWADMKLRCNNPYHPSYPNYGGRGVKVCDRWLGRSGFNNFYDDMGPKPSPKHSLDRYPNNETGHYEPCNCKWRTQPEQLRNKRTNRWLEHNGKKMVLVDWAKYLGLSKSALRSRLHTQTLTEIINKNKNLYT